MSKNILTKWKSFILELSHYIILLLHNRLILMQSVLKIILTIGAFPPVLIFLAATTPNRAPSIKHMFLN